MKLSGKETYSVQGVDAALRGSNKATVTATNADGVSKSFDVLVRVDTPQEAEYFRNDGILPFVLRQLAAGTAGN